MGKDYGLGKDWGIGEGFARKTQTPPREAKL